MNEAEKKVVRDKVAQRLRNLRESVGNYEEGVSAPELLELVKVEIRERKKKLTEDTFFYCDEPAELLILRDLLQEEIKAPEAKSGASEVAAQKAKGKFSKK